uniref:Reverse transcriptase Ty1/copia-type domain-containing protein n=1 Tax=Solanum lycopersicum TaxID=4081 RepID=A0A3Q7H976_SOLLC
MDTIMIQKLKQELSKSFAMKDLGPARQILGMQIVRDRKTKKLVLSQEKYIQKVLRRFSMDKAKVVSTPLAMHFKLSTKQCPSSDDEKEDMKKVPYASAVGSLMYAMVCTIPDIAHAVGVVSHFLSNPGREHWNAVKWVMRYLCGTSSLSLCFGTGKPILCGYTDSDMAGDVDTRKSTSGYLVTFAGGAVSWQSRLQKCVALSTTEAELIAVVEACKELLWMKRFLGELGCAQERNGFGGEAEITRRSDNHHPSVWRDHFLDYANRLKYIGRVLERFNMKNTKLVSTPLAGHMKLSKKMYPLTREEKENKVKVSYSSVVGREAISWQSKLQKCVALSTTEA